MTMADHPRATRLAERIQEIVARMLDTRVKDPRLGFVTVTGVRVTGDLQHASVFYTVLGDEEARAATAAALESAKGLIRSEVGRQTGVRLTPTLEFVPDAVPETAASIAEALREAARRDAEAAALAASAQYAGDPDPYRHEADDVDEEPDEDVDEAVDEAVDETDETDDEAEAAR
jgi:ribosome-binding factor A